MWQGDKALKPNRGPSTPELVLKWYKACSMFEIHWIGATTKEKLLQFSLERTCATRYINHIYILDYHEFPVSRKPRNTCLVLIGMANQLDPVGACQLQKKLANIQRLGRWTPWTQEKEHIQLIQIYIYIYIYSTRLSMAVQGPRPVCWLSHSTPRCRPFCGKPRRRFSSWKGGTNWMDSLVLCWDVSTEAEPGVMFFVCL